MTATTSADEDEPSESIESVAVVRDEDAYSDFGFYSSREDSRGRLARTLGSRNTGVLQDLQNNSGLGE